MTDTEDFVDAPFTLGQHLTLACALTELIVTADSTPHDLPLIDRWHLQGAYPEYSEPRIEGLIRSSSNQDPAAVRSAALLWAFRFDGTVAERATASFIRVTAHFRVQDIPVEIWDHIYPDSTCPTCGGPAVGDQVLKHADDCAVKAAAEAAQSVTAAAVVTGPSGCRVVYTQGGVRKSQPMPDRRAARRWVRDHRSPAAVTS
jgi:hypothetical protein